MIGKLRIAFIAGIVSAAFIQPATAGQVFYGKATTPWLGIYLFTFGMCSSMTWALAQNKAAKRGRVLTIRDFGRKAVLPCVIPPIGMYHVIHPND